MPYATVADVRLAGLTNTTLFPDAAVEASLLLWEQFIDRVTRQFFEPREAEVELDGTDSDTLHFSVPVIQVEALYLNGSSDRLDTSLYKVYNGRIQPADDRKNPRLKLGGDTDADIYTRPITRGAMRFRKGRKNQRLLGTFGYTQPDDSTPLLITRALVKLVIEKLTNPLYTNPDDPPIEPVIATGPLLEEETDDHRMKWGAPGGSTRARSPGLIGITTDREILDILALYRSPIAIATPAHYTYR